MVQIDSLQHLACGCAGPLNLLSIRKGLALCSAGHIRQVRSQRQRRDRAISAWQRCQNDDNRLKQSSL